MGKKWVKAALIVIGVGVLAGAFGSEFESYLLVRIANAIIAGGFGLFVLWTLGRVGKDSTGVTAAKLVVFISLMGVFVYFIFNFWPLVPVYEVLGAILDAMG